MPSAKEKLKFKKLRNVINMTNVAERIQSTLNYFQRGHTYAY